MAKGAMRDIPDHLPDDAPLEDIRRLIYVRRKVEKARRT
jgi:hypothetical protein